MKTELINHIDTKFELIKKEISDIKETADDAALQALSNQEEIVKLQSEIESVKITNTSLV